MGSKRLRIVVIVRCPLCGGWIVGNSYSDHLENVHLPGAERGFSAAGCGPGDENPPLKILGAESALQGGGGAEELLVDAAGSLSASEAGRLLSELGRRFQQGQDASLGFLMYD
jgi:hypothetical protein